MSTRSKPSKKSQSRTQKRHLSKTNPRPVSLIGGGQGGVLGPSMSAGGMWG